MGEYFTTPRGVTQVYDKEINNNIKVIIDKLDKHEAAFKLMFNNLIKNGTTLNSDNSKNAESATNKAVANAINNLNNSTSTSNNAVQKELNGILQYNVTSSKKAQVASMNAQKTSRAVNNALFGKVERGLSIFNDIKDMVKSVVGILKKQLQASLRAYDDATKALRQQFKTTDEIKHELLLADKARASLEEKGIRLNSSEIKPILSQLAENNLPTNMLDEHQLGTLALFVKTAGASVKEAYALVRNAKTDKEIDDLRRIAINSSDKSSAGFKELLKHSEEAWFQLYFKNDTNKMLSIQEAMRKFDALALPNGGDAKHTAELFSQIMKISSGQIDLAQENKELNQALIAITGNSNFSDPMQLIDGLKKIQESGNENQIRALRKSIPENTYKLLQTIAINGKNANELKVRGYNENLEAVNQSVKGGTVGYSLDGIISKINVMTSGFIDGGIFGAMSAELSELFGEDASMESVVSNGFTMVIKILTMIIASKIFTSIPSLLTTGLTVLPGIGAVLSKLGLVAGGATAAGATVAGEVAAAGATAAGATAAGATAAGTTAIKTLGKAVSKLAVPLTLAIGAFEVYNASKSKADIKVDKTSSQSVIRAEREQERLRQGKMFGATIKTLSAAIGGAVGSALGPLGTVAGAAAAGAVADTIVDSTIESSTRDAQARTTLEGILENTKRLEYINKVLNDEKNPISESLRKTLEKEIPLLQASINGGNSSMAQANIDVLLNNNESLEAQVNTTKQITDYVKELQEKAKELEHTYLTAKEQGDRKNAEHELEELLPKLEAAKKAAYISATAKPLQEGESLDSYIRDKALMFNKLQMKPQLTDDNLSVAISSQYFSKLSNGFGLGDHDDFLEGIQTDAKKNANAAAQSIMLALDKLNIRDENARRDFVHRILSEFDDKQVANDVLSSKELKVGNINLNVPPGGIPVQVTPDKGVGTKYANGGIVDKATPALVGEAGKEAILPLTRPNRILNILQSLNNNEKLLILKSLLNGNLSKDLFINMVASFASNTIESSYDDAVSKLKSWKGGKLKPAEFIEMLGPIAHKDNILTGIPASITLAQAALESGWGKTANSSFTNLFGIKGKGNAGSVNVNTHEYYNGQRTQTKDNFAQYSSYLDSINAHSQYLLNAKRPKHNLPGDLRYAEALMNIFDPDTFAYKLKEGGYATSPTYAQKLIGIMRQHNLYKWDADASELLLTNAGDIQKSLINKSNKFTETIDKLSSTTEPYTKVAEPVLNSVKKTIDDNISSAIVESAATFKGTPYSSMTCNMFVEAALRKAGFTPPTTGNVYKHFNSGKFNIVLNDPVNGISPTDPALKPGMIAFSRPFTLADANAYNAKSGGSRKPGDPGHMGIYAGNGLWWNSTSAKKFKDFSSGTGIDSYTAGVALTKPYTKGTYRFFAAGYYDGMLDKTETTGLPSASASVVSENELSDKLSEDNSSISEVESASFLSRPLNEQLELAKQAMGALLTSTDVQVQRIGEQYIKQAMSLLNSNNSKEVIEALGTMIKYLKDIALSSNKLNYTPVSRPVNTRY